MKTPQHLLPTVAVCLALFAAPAAADLLFSTFPWSTGGGWGVVGPQEPLGQPETDAACEFHVPPTSAFDHIEVDLPLDNVWGTPITDVMIMATDRSLYPPRPGALLALRTVVAPGSGGVVHVVFPDTLVLEADSTYWLALSTPADGFQGWNWSQNVVDYWRAYKTRSAGWWAERGQFCGFEVYGVPSVTGVPREGAGPVSLACGPNPFATVTTLAWRLDEERVVTLRVFDVRGRLVRTCVAGERQGPGEHRVAWEGTNESGARVAPGVYFARLDAGMQARTQRMVRLD